jgi:hypothetical protein
MNSVPPSGTPVTARLGTGTGSVVAMFTSEARYFAAMSEFLAARYPSETVDRVAVPGGPWWLAKAASLSESRVKRIILGELKPVREAMRSLVDSHDLRELVLIAAQDCAWYRRLYPRLSPGETVRRQGEDMVRARDEALRWAGRPISVSGHILTFDAQGAITFRTLIESNGRL